MIETRDNSGISFKAQQREHAALLNGEGFVSLPCDLVADVAPGWDALVDFGEHQTFNARLSLEALASSDEYEVRGFVADELAQIVPILEMCMKIEQSIRRNNDFAIDFDVSRQIIDPAIHPRTELFDVEKPHIDAVDIDEFMVPSALYMLSDVAPTATIAQRYPGLGCSFSDYVDFYDGSDEYYEEIVAHIRKTTDTLPVRGVANVAMRIPLVHQAQLSGNSELADISERTVLRGSVLPLEALHV